jgi:hypothetical protein
MLMMMVVTTENCDFSATRGPNPVGLVSIGPCSLSIGIEIKESMQMVLYWLRYCIRTIGSKIRVAFVAYGNCLLQYSTVSMIVRSYVCSTSISRFVTR